MPIPILVLIRHGEIEPPKGILFGQLDFPLTEKGIETMKRVAKIIFKTTENFCHPIKGNIHFFTSDLSRCAKSLDLILEIFYQNTDIIHDKNETALLREYYLGHLEGQYIVDVRNHLEQFIENYKKNPWHAKPLKGESHYVVAHRIFPLVKNLNHKFQRHLLSENCNQETYEVHIWIVHEGSARMTMQLLNVETPFRVQNVEDEFIHDRHQTFFNKGDIIILKPVGIYNESSRHDTYYSFSGTCIPDGLNRSLGCFTGWSILEHIVNFI